MAQSTDDRLRLLVERIERLEEEKQGIADDIKDVYAEAKAVGYDTKIIRKIIRLRKMKPDDRSEEEILLETYKAALGMGGTPLGNYADHLRDMDAKGIGVSVQVAGGEKTPLNRTAAAKLAEAEA